MIILDVNSVGKNFGYGELFQDVSFSLNEEESISIVGPNGCGKSTLLKIIAGLEKPDKGVISIKKDAKVTYLDQTASSVQDDRNCLEILKEVFQDLNEMEGRLQQLQKKLETPIEEAEYVKVLKRYCDLMEEFSSNRWI